MWTTSKPGRKPSPQNYVGPNLHFGPDLGQQPPELGENTFLLLKAPSRWYRVIVDECLQRLHALGGQPQSDLTDLLCPLFRNQLLCQDGDTASLGLPQLTLPPNVSVLPKSPVSPK